MVAIRLKTVVGEDRKLIIQLPDEIPPGGVELVVRASESSGSNTSNPVREAARAKLLAAGALVTEFNVPPNAVRLTVEERMRLGTLPPDARLSLDLINEDRGEW